MESPFSCEKAQSTMNLDGGEAEAPFRPLAYFPKDIWGARFLHANVDNSEIDEYAKQINLPKCQVRALLVDEGVSQNDRLELINCIERLGIFDHFKEEIKDQLEKIFEAYNYDIIRDLYTISMHFRVFRQNGHNMSIGTFDKLRDSEGMLQERLKCDVKGILSLYEAAHLRMHNEEFLDESLHITSHLLQAFASGSLQSKDPCLYNQVAHAVKQPYHTGIRKVEARHFISFYQEDMSRNETLLRLAKLDFNMMQLLYRQELSQIVRWWKEMDVKTQLSYVRDRSVECHLWSVAMYSEARYSGARLLMSKLFCLITILDDTYDSYGTREELNLLTQALSRWDKSGMDELPGKMKLVFSHVYNICNGFQREMAKEGREYAAVYTRERVLDLARSYFVEANWAHENYVPCFVEYMSNAGASSTTEAVLTTAFMGMEPHVSDEKVFEWTIDPVPRVIRGCEVIGRLMNDIVSHQEEQSRGLHVSSGVECYMNEHGVNKDEAVGALRKVINDAWKDMNEQLVKQSAPVPRAIINVVFNMARLVDAHYKEFDGYTHAEEVMKADALAVYVESFSI